MTYDEARAKVMKHHARYSMWRKDWQKNGVETYVMYFENTILTHHGQHYHVKPYWELFKGDTVEYCWTPTLIDVSADDWVVTDEYEKAAAAKWEKIKEKITIAKPAKNELANCRCGGKPYVDVSCESKTVKDVFNRPISIKYQNYINIICSDCGAKYEYPIEKFRTLSPFEVLEDADKERIIMNWNLMNDK